MVAHDEFMSIYQDFANCRGQHADKAIFSAWYRHLRAYSTDQVTAAMAKAAMVPRDRAVGVGDVLAILGPQQDSQRVLEARGGSEETERGWADVERHNRAGRKSVFEIAEDQSRHDPAALRRVREPGPTRDFLAMAQSVIDKQRAGRTGEARAQAGQVAQAMVATRPVLPPPRRPPPPPPAPTPPAQPPPAAPPKPQRPPDDRPPPAAAPAAKAAPEPQDDPFGPPVDERNPPPAEMEPWPDWPGG